MPLTAREVIRLLDLKPHPEGGHFRETFRDGREVDTGRAASTAIYFLLARGECSHWHRIDAAEIWHWYAGAALELEIAREDGRRETARLGNDLSAARRLHRRAGLCVRAVRAGAEGVGAGMKSRRRKGQ